MNIDEIRTYFKLHQINMKNVNIDYELMAMFKIETEINFILKDVIETGSIENQKVLDKQNEFIQIVKYDGEIGIAILIYVVNNQIFIKSVFPTVKTNKTYSLSHWYPTDIEIGDMKESSCIELEYISFFDFQTVFDKASFASKNNKYSIFGFAIQDYNKFSLKYDDETFEDSIKVVKTLELEGPFEWIKSFKKNFLKCYANINEKNRDMKNDWELGPEIKIPIYIPKSIYNLEKNFYNEKIIDVLLLGFVKHK